MADPSVLSVMVTTSTEKVAQPLPY
jgi:hypothetical protein